MPIVRRGASYPGVAPLMGMTLPTVEGRLRLGYGRNWRAGVGLLLPVDPTVPLPATVARKPAVHGVALTPRGRGLGAAGSWTLTNTSTGQVIASSGGLNFSSVPGILVGPDFPPGSAKVGDRWQITFSGYPPNNGFALNASHNGLPMPMSGQQDLPASILLGKYQDGNAPWAIADSSGGGTITGTFSKDAIGGWVITSGGYGIAFTVTDASGNLAPYTGQVQPGGTPYYQQLGQQPAITGQVPTTTVQSLQDQLAARGMTLSATGQLVPVTQSSGAGPAASGSASGGAAGGAASGSGGGSISDLVSGFSLSSIPTWGWIAAAGVGALLLFGGHKHGA